MSSIEFTTNFSEVAAAFDNIDVKVDDIIADLMRETGQTIIRQVKSDTPVDTGFLRDSWRMDVELSDDLDLNIDNTANYASFVHRKGDKSKRPIIAKMAEDKIQSEASSLRALLEARIAAALNNTD